MSLTSRLRRWWGGPRADPQVDRSESDVPIDPALASSRATGGEHTHLSGDRGSVTGTGDTEEFVGQVAGDDLGYAGETGAERRSAAGENTAATSDDHGRSSREDHSHDSGEQQ